MRFRLLSAVSALAFVTCGFALEDVDPKLAGEDKKKGEWYFTPYIGESHTRSSGLLLRRPGTRLNYENVHWRDESYKGPLYYGFKFTYWPNDAILGLSIDFIHYKVFADIDRSTQVTGVLNGQPYNQNEPISNTLGRWSISHGVNYFTVNGLLRPRPKSGEYGSGKFFPYGGAGFGFVVNHPESDIDNEFFQQYQWGGWTWQVFAGVEYRVNSKWGIFGEYKYTDYHARVETALNGTGEAHLRTSHFAFGTTYRFK